MTLTQDLLKAKWKKCTSCKGERKVAVFSVMDIESYAKMRCDHCKGTGTEPQWFENKYYKGRRVVNVGEEIAVCKFCGDGAVWVEWGKRMQKCWKGKGHYYHYSLDYKLGCKERISEAQIKDYLVFFKILKTKGDKILVVRE